MSARFVDQTLSQYLADSRLGSSALARFARSRREYEANRHSDSRALVFGGAFDCLLLEPHDFESRYWAGERGDYSGKGAATAWEDFKERASAAGASLIHHADVAACKSMVEAVMGSEAAHLFRAPGMAQQTVHWDEFGVRCKARADRLVDEDLPIVVEVKTAIDPRPREFHFAAVRLGYGLRAPHYVSGFTAALGSIDYRIVVVGKTAPHQVVQYRMTKVSMELALQRREQLLEQLARCFEGRDFSDPYEHEVQDLSFTEQELGMQHEPLELTMGGIAIGDL